MGHIFISYSRKDTEYAHALAESLQSMGFSVWIDARLDYGSQWPHELQKQLDTCQAFLLVMSPSSYASEWVQSELQRAKRKNKPIFPLLLEGEEPWLSVESTQYYDVRNGKLPDDEFYSDLKRAATLREAGGQALSQSPTSNKIAGKRLAGILAAVGCIAVIGICLIVGGLLFRQVAGNILPFSTELDLPTTQPAPFENTTPSAANPATAAVPLPVELPDGSEVVMIAPGGSTFQYTILSAQREPLPPDKQLLHLRIRVWMDYGPGVNFVSDSFRLAADDLRLAPVNFFSEVVARDETMDGDVRFEMDSSLKEAVLVITVGGYHDPWAVKELRLVFP